MNLTTLFVSDSESSFFSCLSEQHIESINGFIISTIQQEYFFMFMSLVVCIVISLIGIIQNDKEKIVIGSLFLPAILSMTYFVKWLMV